MHRRLHRVALLIAVAFAFLFGGQGGFIVSGSDVLVPAARMWCRALGGWQVQGGGSAAAIADVQSGRSNAGLLSRAPAPKELRDDLVCRLIGYDPLVVITAADSPIDCLTLNALKNVYNGTCQNWSLLGGKDRPVVTVHRESGSGTLASFVEQTGCNGNAHLIAAGDGVMKLLVSANPNAIGYISQRLADDSVKTPDLFGADLRRPLYLIYAKGDSGGAALADFVLSPTGQKILSKAGFDPV